MDLDRCVAIVTDQLTATAALGDDRTRAVAAALAASAANAVSLAVISAVAAAADEVNTALLATSTGITVSVHLEDDEPTIRVHPAPDAELDLGSADLDDGAASARISLRLPEALKVEVDAAASTASVSVNTWLVRAARAALARNHVPSNHVPSNHVPSNHESRNRSGQHIRGWVTG